MRYCFLETIYVKKNTELYEVVQCECSPLFSDVVAQRLTLEDLKILAEDRAVLCDFSFDENGFFKCSPTVKRINVTNLSGDDLVREIQVSSSGAGFTDLLYEGAIKDFWILGDATAATLVNVDSVEHATDVVHFNSIRFSQNTMSVYAQIVDGNSLYNLMLVYLENGVLRQRPFYFCTNPGEGVNTAGCKFIKEVTINGVHKLLWYSGILMLYDENDFISTSMINKAVCTSMRQRAAVDILSDYLASCWDFLYPDKKSESLEWGGGNNSYVSQYGVSFKSSMKRLSKAEKELVINTVLSDLSLRCSSLQEMKVALRDYAWSPLMKFVAQNLFIGVNISSGDTSDLVRRVQTVKDHAISELFFSDLFLYRIRTKAYVMHINIVDPMKPIIGGGNEMEVTYVQEGFFYGVL